MGTNFYTNPPGDFGDILTEKLDKHSPKYHIGKRSAAGWYCWDCGITLCKEGNTKVHAGKADWHHFCPICGVMPRTETLENSAAGKELGFNKSKPTIKTKVTSCSSFTWAMEPETMVKHKFIYDEYGAMFTKEQFIVMLLKDCPIQYYHSLGEEFSQENKMNANKWHKVGSVGVDAGLIWIGDPCYVLHKENLPKELGTSWGDFCTILQEKEKTDTDQVAKNNAYAFSNLGIAISSGYGDGIYDVFIKLNNGNRVAEAKIVFIDSKNPDDEDFDEDDYEDFDDDDYDDEDDYEEDDECDYKCNYNHKSEDK